MTDVRGAIELTPEAEARLVEYLGGVRVALAGSADVSPDEIEADIREHVENELRDAPRPVGLPALEAVLDRLGPPDKWATGEPPSPLRRAGLLIREKLRAAREAAGGKLHAVGEAARGRLRTARDALWTGPEDRRLAYLAFGVFALGVVTVVLFPVCLLVSYLLARGGLAVAREHGVQLDGGRRWLLYPPLVIVASGLLLVVALGPPVGGTAAAWELAYDADRRERWELAGRPRNMSSNGVLRMNHPEVVTSLDRVLDRFPGDRESQRVLAGGFAGVGVFALWGVVLGSLGVAFPGVVRGVFCPLLDGFRRGHGWWLALVSLLVLIGWVVVAFEILANAGLIAMPGG